CLFILPATLNLVTPGTPAFVLARFPPLHQPGGASPEMLAVTKPGLWVAARFLARTWLCISIVGLLTTTTPSAKLLRGLRSLGLPVTFVTVLQMMERYLALLARSAEEIHLAQLSRTLAFGQTRREQARVAAGMGSLFRRTQRLGQSVFLAM